MTYTRPQTLWWTQPGVPFDPKREAYMAPCDTGFDMTEHGWVKIGEGTLTCTITPGLNPLQEQIKAIDKQVEVVNTECQKKFHDLWVLKNNLLALEAPKESTP